MPEPVLRVQLSINPTCGQYWRAGRYVGACTPCPAINQSHLWTKLASRPLCWSVYSMSNYQSIPPVDNIGEQVVMPEPVLRVHLLVIDCEGPVQNASLLKYKQQLNQIFVSVVFVLTIKINKKHSHIPQLDVRETPLRKRPEFSPQPSGPW